MSTFTKFATDKLRECAYCFEEPVYYEMGHGRTPYIINCDQKTKRHDCVDLYTIMPSGVGWHLNHEHAITAWNDYHDAVQWWKDRGYCKPSQNQIREYMYREWRGIGHNPLKFREGVG